MEQTVKSGDFVHLTDPISNGEIVRIESINEHGFASWLGGSQAADMELVEIEKKEISDFPISGEEYHYKISLTDKVEQIERDFGVKLYPESAVEFWKNRAEVEKKEHAYYEQAWEKEHSKLLNAQDEIAKLNEHIIKVCKESSADIQKLDEENKELKKELSDNKNHIEVLLGRIEKLELEKHSLDQVAKVFQSDLGKKDTEINELKKRILLLEAELREID